MAEPRDARQAAHTQLPDGTWVPAESMGWQEEHNWLQRVLLWLLRRPHCGKG